MVMGTGFLALIVRHISKEIPKAQYITVMIITVMEAALLVVNIFYPIVFSIDENNVYRRVASAKAVE